MFDSLENKKMIWNLLLSQTNSNVINDGNFQNYFETLVQQIDANKQGFDKVVDMNKELLSRSLQAIRAMIQQKQPEESIYEKRLAEKQQELKIMQDGGIKPKDIDFLDNRDKDFEDVNMLMTKSQEQRTRELENIAHAYKADDALKWIQNENTSSTNQVSTNQVPKLTIHEPKKVSFNLEKQKSNICVKMSFTENGVNKTMICNLSNGFRVFMSPHGKIEEKPTGVLENVEMFTN